MRTIDKSRTIQKELNVTLSNKNIILEIFNELPIGVIIISGTTNYWFNYTLINILGYKKEEAAYHKIKEELIPLVLDKIEFKKSLILEDHSRNIEISLKNKEQQSIFLNIIPKNIHFNNQKSLLLLINDVSAQKISEKEYHELMENMQTGIIIYNSDKSILYSNQNVTKLLGLSIDQLKGKEIIDQEWRFVREDGSLMPIEEFTEIIVTLAKKPLQNYIMGVKKATQKNITWILCNAFPTYDNNNIHHKTIVSFIDITEIRKNEKN